MPVPIFFDSGISSGKKCIQYGNDLGYSNAELKMKKILGIAAAVFMVVFVTKTETAGESPDVDARIKQASQVLLGNSASREEMVQALAQLMDCAAMLSEKSRYADEIKSNLDIAKNEIMNNSLFSDKGRQKLSFAYRMLTNGQKYQPSKELDEFITPAQATEKARKYAENLVDQALKNLRAGNPLPAAQNLVEIVLMIVTPISGSQHLLSFSGIAFISA